MKGRVNLGAGPTDYFKRALTVKEKCPFYDAARERGLATREASY